MSTFIALIALVLTILYLAVPPALWFKGRQWIGPSTHLAVLFLIAVVAMFVIQTLASNESLLGAATYWFTFVWVALNFATFALVPKLRQKFSEET